METATTLKQDEPTTDSIVIETDVLIIGAGISGLGAAQHLQAECPDKDFLILEGKEGPGGTWRQHTYPGIRSDSDLFTFGYKARPWSGNPIAQADLILDYLDETIADTGLAKRIRYKQQVLSAQWSSESATWTLTVLSNGSDQITYRSRFLLMCAGYYRHSKGYTPNFPNMESFKGQIVHPQHWPDDLPYEGKKVVVIGSGATAATLIPAMAEKTASITMLQRSPTWFHTGENRNELADQLRALEVPEEWTHEIVRRQMLAEQKEISYLANESPDVLKEELISVAREHLGPDFDLETHFMPSYRPWQQRLAFVPEGDLFRCLREGSASVVTDQISRFTETGILLESGKELEADIIVTATGFNLSVFGDIEFSIDGEDLEYQDRWTWRGIMATGLPNLASYFGYLRTSWTMRVDLVSELVCRLLNHMDEKGATTCTPKLRANDADMTARPFIDPQEFNPGYLNRSIHLFPKQGSYAPWVLNQDYYTEKDELPVADFEDGSLQFS